MARNVDDLFYINLELNATLSLDWERVEEDKIYQQFVMIDKSSALQNYLEYYLSKDKLLSKAPFTNGPGCFTSFRVI